MITYLIGAGASIETVPINDKLTNSISNILFLIRRYSENNKNKGEAFSQGLGWLSDKAAQYKTIDTFGKQLWLKKTIQSIAEFKLLKDILTCIFIMLQIDKKQDRRYDSFFGNILSTDINGFPKMKNDFSILSWNYDYCFEKSFVGFCENSENVEYIANHKNIIHLNGSSLELTINRTGQKTWTFFDLHIDDENEKIKTIIEIYDNLLNNSLCAGIKFAWEDLDSNKMEQAIQIMKDTKTLVVIGYSFPYFNREIDRLLIRAGEFNKIYLQCNGDKGSRFRLTQILNEINYLQGREPMIEEVDTVDYFFLP